MLYVILLTVVFFIVMLSDVVLCVIMLRGRNIVMLSFNILGAILLSVCILIAVVP